MDLITTAISAAEKVYALAQTIIKAARKKGELTAQQEMEFQQELNKRTSQEHWKSKDVP